MNRRYPWAYPAMVLTVLGAACAHADDWPMLRHDLQRSGRSADCVGPPYTQAWVAVFADEIITTRSEPIVAGGRVFVGTYSARLHCLDAQTGRPHWTADLQGPILHAPAVSDATVYCASLSGVWALDMASGKVRWRSEATPGGYCTSPAVTQGLVLLGGRDGVFRALAADSGELRWSLATEGPIRTTAAVEAGRVYFASDDMRAYAADLATGALRWRSEKLFGQSLRDYYPVLAGKRLVLRSNPAVHFASRIHEDGALLCKLAGLPDNRWQSVDALLKSDRVFASPEAIRREQEAILEHLQRRPQARTCFLLDLDTGRETARAPVLYVGGCNGVAPPPVVLDDGRLLIMYRSACSNFTHGVAPLVGLGFLDSESGWIEPIYHDHGRQPPWNTFWGTADEAQNFSLGGDLLYIAHQGTLSSLDLKTKRLMRIAGNRDTWGGLPGVGWTLNEWHGPARGSAAVAGDMLYWITGSRVIAVRGRKR